MGSFAFDPGDANRAFATTRICNVGATGIPGVIVAGDGKTDANGAGDYPKGGLPGTTEERRDTVENAVALATGVVTRDLSMINAFVAEVPASALPALAARSDVRWISLDAPVVSTAADAHRIAIPHQANGNQNQPLLNT